MDYKKEYEEMVQRVKELHEAGNVLTKKQIEIICPELAESEDERVRKSLIKFLTDINEILESGRTTWAVRKEDAEMCKSFLAYLEKQKYNRLQPIYDNQESFESALDKAWKSYNDSGARTVDSCEDDYVECAHAKGFREGFLFGIEKQKENPKSANSISPDCTSDAKFEDRWHKVTDSLPDNGREVLAKDKLGNTLLARYDGEGWDVSVYDNEDYRCHIGISKWCEIPSEKQKEPHYTKRNALFDKCVENCDQEVMKEISDKVDEMLEKEQKPVEKISVSEELYEHIRNACACIEDAMSSDTLCDMTDYLEMADSSAKKAFDMVERSVVKQPAEWSDEDEKMLNSALWHIKNSCGNGGKTSGEYEVYHWLKSLPERFVLQPKQEWSNEDERMRNQLIYDVEYHKKEGLISAKKNKATKALYNGIEKCYDEKIAWLKSLRPKPHWKPSEDEERLIKTSISFLKDFADKGYENAVECIDWLKSKLK